MSRLFGWSYPPGVSSLPWDRESRCEVCGEYESHCICPECPVCGEAGNPTCYDKHIQLSIEQIESLAWCMNIEIDEARAEDKWLLSQEEKDNE